ncbi:MAG TPA: hypothetical protein VF530_20875, partial [Planctomycetota bacterium]
SLAGPGGGRSGAVSGAVRDGRSAARARRVTWLLCLLALGLALRALLLLESRRVALGAVLGGTLDGLRLGLGLAAGLALAAAWRAHAGAGPAGLAGLARGLVVVAVLGWLAFVALVEPFQRLWLELGLGLAAGVWALGLLLGPALRRRPRLGRALDLGAFALCLGLLGLELGLRAWARVWPTALNARPGAAPRELVARHRCAPGLVRFGFACNRRGYYDEEFEPRAPGDERPRIVAIGDSFHVGMVPHAWHFTTLTEERLAAEILNLGVPGIGPPEYLSLLVEEGLALEPDLVLISVFVGNDLNVPDVLAERSDAALRAWFQRDQVLLFVLPARWARLRAQGALRPGPDLAASGARPMDRAGAAQAFPWVLDPALEEPTYSEETFLWIETTRALDLCAGVPPALELLRRSLRAAQRAAGDVPLCVLLIPDEFQVEDELWERVQRAAGRALDRDAPQRLVTAWLAEQGIPCLDLLPVLRAVPPGPDGRRHLYHLRDTHFNARGNHRTAEALAEFLARRP